MARNRTKYKRQGKKSYSIIVDGQTEKWYLDLMKYYEKQKLPRIDIKPEIPKRKKLKELYNQVKENANIYDKVIWIIDLDVILRNNQIIELKKYINELKKNDRVIVLANNPCLEFWFLIHMNKTTRVFQHCTDVEKELRKFEILKDYEKTEKYYKSSHNDIYSKLKPYQQKAINTARKLGNLDFTNINTAKAEMYKIFDIINNK